MPIRYTLNIVRSRNIHSGQVHERHARGPFSLFAQIPNKGGNLFKVQVQPGVVEGSELTDQSTHGGLRVSA